MTENLIAVADGIAERGDPLYFVTASGRVKPFVLLGQGEAEFPSRDRYVVAEPGASLFGLYDPDSCFIDARRAEAEAARRRDSYRRLATLTLTDLDAA